MTESTLPIFPFTDRTGLDAFPEYARLRRDDPVPMVELAEGGQAYLATRYEDVRRVLNDPVFSRAASQRPESVVLSQHSRNPYSLLNMDPPEHTRIRRVLTPSFTTAVVERLRPRVQEITDELVDAMRTQGPPAEFVSAFAAALPARVIAELIGVPHADRARVLAWPDVFLQAGAYPPEEFAAIMGEFTAYLTQLIAAKRVDPADDWTSALVTVPEDEAKLSEPELLSTVLALIVGGYETTAGLLANAIVVLHHHPDQVALLRDKPELVPDAVEEILRYVPIAWCSLERVALKDVELSGVRIPAGASVIPVTYAANRDFAEDPERLDLTRGRRPHLAFGSGIHRCIGAPLARIELQTAFATLFRRMPNLRPAVPDDELTWKTGLRTIGPMTLPVTW